MTFSVTKLAPVWVVESALGPDPGPAYVLASRLGCLFRRVRMEMLALDSFLEERREPGLILASGWRSGYAALKAGRRAGCPVVWCVRHEGRSAPMLRSMPFDLVVAPSPADPTARFCPTLGPMTIVSPALLARARRAWQERLEHLPFPRVTVLVGENVFRTQEEALLQGKKLAGLINRQGGSALLVVRDDSKPDLTEAFMMGLSETFLLVWRQGEPDEEPLLGFMACSDCVVVGGGESAMLVEACVADLPVFLMEREQDLRGVRGRLARRLIQDGHVRVLTDTLSPWPREVLDEAGRVAGILKSRWAL
ncbi:ELM1/GtrOC1 family putative glycosyltransferase [Acetobacter persici]|uniref:ELM1/GtrOC1 family putative glycosyltransferase n=1 Tax=Acetobacter persici TaxID=1076596 RepID=UPI001F2ACF70|nr:ELM1/GtrOC1 family putative glycosyltransferase [Acetobacter persici]MCG0996605.1 mitochondrial fission ELM1 family protein [Acetobacter persici]